VFLIKPKPNTPYSFAGHRDEELAEQFRERVPIGDPGAITRVWEEYVRGDADALRDVAEALEGEFPFILKAVEAHIDRIPREGDPGRPVRTLLEIVREIREIREMQEMQEMREMQEMQQMREAREMREMQEKRDVREIREAREMEQNREVQDTGEVREVSGTAQESGANHDVPFGAVFHEFQRREAIYGFGDLQIKRLFDAVMAGRFS